MSTQRARASRTALLPATYHRQGQRQDAACGHSCSRAALDLSSLLHFVSSEGPLNPQLGT
jgi:hypothetical protein